MTERDIFIAALQIADKAERAAYLAQACGSDQVLLNRVEQLLRTNEDAESFLASPAPGLADTISIPMVTAGQIIGPYKLLQQIGEGGMGVVYMAEQSEPVHRKVALKIIKPGMDSRQVIARFEAERQALAMMDHVNIARVIDGGTISGGEGAGRPYFVMELINGIPITKYCDDNHLTPRERLELFIPVCQAIQHAHQKGIIHRDIKPSNVLVTIYDGKPVPKVIDFGVAKAIDQKLTDNTLFTNFGTMVGTLEYMSPEQAEMNNLGVDTRSDIYSLGVLLYELLTGSTPLTRKRLKEAANLEILRLIKEEEPQKPSTRLSESGDALASISALRKTEPAKLSKLMRGELDWIVMKTLEKDRNRRYETANGLAVEVQRYLADETVLACPPSTGYRVRKFVQRNRTMVGAVGLVLLSLIIGITGTTWGMIDANQARYEERDRAEGEKRAKLDAISQKNDAEMERKYAKAIADFVISDILALTSIAGQDRFAEGEKLGPNRKNLTLLQLLNRAGDKLDQRTDLAPRTDADLRWMIGVSYRELGDSGKSIGYLKRCAELRHQFLGPENLDTISAENSLALAFIGVDRPKEAIKILEHVRDHMVAKHGAENINSLAASGNLALAYRKVGRLAEALQLHKQVYAVRKAQHGDNHPSTLLTLSALAVTYCDMGNLPEAIRLNDQVAIVLEQQQFNVMRLPNIVLNMFKINRATNQHEKVERWARNCLPVVKVQSGADSEDVAAVLWALGLSLLKQKKLSEAEPVLSESIGILDKQRSDNKFPIMSNLGTALIGQKKYAEAEPLYQELAEYWKTKAGADSPQFAEKLGLLGLCLFAQSKFVVAEPIFRECLAIDEKIKPDDWYTFFLRTRVGVCLSEQRNYASAEQLLLSGYEGMKKREEKIPPSSKTQLNVEVPKRLVKLYTDWGKEDKAEEWRKKLPKTESIKPQEKKQY